MILFEVTDTELDSHYWTDYETAEACFNSCVNDVLYPTDSMAVTLRRIHVPVTSDVVLRLLNGNGGYITREKVLKTHTWK